jgi:N-methylhydantoinase A
MELLLAAEGIHRIANARTMRALRAVSTERGRDPRDFIVMAFGGSGPIHAAGLAQELFIRRIVVPPLPGLFSALGLLFSGIEHHDVRSCLLSVEGLKTEALLQIREEMRQKMLVQFKTEGHPGNQVTLSCSVDMRFRGQTSEIRIPLEGGVLDENALRGLQKAFEQEHERLYGHRSDPDNPVEVVAVRLVGQASARGHEERLKPAERPGERESSRRAHFGEPWGTIDTPVVARRALSGSMDGPLLIDEYDSTTVVPPNRSVHLDDQGYLVMESNGA